MRAYKALIQVQAGNIILSHIQSIVVALKREGHPPQFCDLGNSFPLLWISTNIAVDIFNQIGNYFQAQAALTPEEDKRRKKFGGGGVEEYERRDDSDSDVTLTWRCANVRYN